MKLEPNKEAEHGEEKKSNIFEKKKTNQKWKNEMRKKKGRSAQPIPSNNNRPPLASHKYAAL